MYWIKDKRFLKKSFELGIIMCLFTVPFEMSGNIIKQYRKLYHTNVPWPWYIIIPLIFFMISIVMSLLLDLIYCIANLYSKKSAIWVTITSVKVIIKNFFDYIVFVLSFLPWFSIELVGMILLAILAPNLQGTYTLSMLYLVFVTPIMMGIGFYFWPYYNVAKAIFCKELVMQRNKH